MAAVPFLRNIGSEQRSIDGISARSAATTRTKKGDQNPHWRGGLVKLTCRQCQKEFGLSPGEAKKEDKGIFCSAQCRYDSHRIFPDLTTSRREHRRRREARERMSRRDDATHTREQWLELVRRAKGRCVMCKKKRPLVRDHIIPVSKGGSDHITNIQPLCSWCNCSKHDKVLSLL